VSDLGPPLSLKERLRAALAEDLPQGDPTSEALIPEGMLALGRVVAGQELVASGLSVVEPLISLLDPKAEVKPLCRDGELMARGEPLCEIRAGARAMLMAERVMLNLLMRLCGIATLTRRAVEVAGGTQRVRILDTRKTTPLWRDLEKAAVRHGGGVNHRHSLSAMVLVKENHLRLAGFSFSQVVLRARELRPPSTPVEVEVEGLAQLEEALASGADRILLDNFPPQEVVRAVRMRDDFCRRREPRYPDQVWPVELEASGGITLANLSAYAQTGVEMVSLGMLTHSAPAVNLSLEVEPLSG